MRRLALRAAALAGLGLSLTACLAGLPVTSLVELSRLDPTASDPSAMRFALRSPDAIRVRDGDAKVYLGFAESGRPAIEGRWTVRRLSVPLPQALAEERRAGADLGLFALSAADAADMRRVQAAIRARKAAGADGEGTFSVAITGCRTGPVPTGPVPVSAFLQTGPERSFIPLFVDADLRDALAARGASLADAEVCADG